MIVVYHILLFWFVHNGTSPVHVYKAICIPLHIGVILYVLISGYFGIRFSLKGVMRLLANLFLYGLVLSLVGHFCLGDVLDMKELFFVSNTPFWFVKIYLMLYLVSPILNRIILNLTTFNRIFLISIFAWMSCFMGLLGFDISLSAGKNLIHFVLLYLIGNTLSLYKEKVNRIPVVRCVLGYFFINALCIVSYLLCIGTNIEGLSYSIAFQYNSPALIINAICFFILFMRINFKSMLINNWASSCLAIYLIHSSLLFLNHTIKNAALYIQNLTDNVILIMLMVCPLALLIVIGSIFMDKLFLPYWKLVEMITNRLNNTKIGTLASIWANQ